MVTTTASKQALLMREIAGPEKMPWVRMAYTLVASADINLRGKKCNALQISTSLDRSQKCGIKWNSIMISQ